MEKSDVLIWCAIVVFFVLFTSGFIVGINDWVEESRYDLYYVEAPFGVIWVDTEGSFIFASGSFDSTLRESYIVKYFDVDELKSAICDSETTSIVVDGTFRLRKTASIRSYGWFWWRFSSRVRKLKYVIYLPQLPNVTDLTGTEY